MEPGHCFITIRSRQGADARTPALWIRGGTGRRGPASGTVVLSVTDS
ncbi:DUF5701 family protein [Actinoplanes rectilineatus]|nr:DUF5701 family protein [Actinoplanes rectilineatus]